MQKILSLTLIIFISNYCFSQTVEILRKSEKIQLSKGNDFAFLETKTDRNLYTISHPELLENFPKYLPNVLNRKNKLKIFTHLIAPEFVKDLNLPAYTNDEFREVRFLPDQFSFNSTMITMNDHVALFSLKDGNIYAVTIASPTFSNMFKQIFLFVWGAAIKRDR